jgi:hypothetical protein
MILPFIVYYFIRMFLPIRKGWATRVARTEETNAFNMLVEEQKRMCVARKHVEKFS